MNKPSILINGSWADHQIPALKELDLSEQLYDTKDDKEKLILKIRKTFKNYKKIKNKLKKKIKYLRQRSEKQVNFITNKI
jgi:hypothetical protein